MSIPEATKKHLTTVRTKLSTKALMDALQAGGMPTLKYATVYSVLRRREGQVQDIINMDGDWALAAWHPNWRSKKASAKSEQDDKPEDKKEQKEKEHKEKEGKAAS
jgi:hypothetical protein